MTLSALTIGRIREFWRGACISVCAASGLLLATCPSRASPPSETLGHYQQTVFDQAEGAPGGIGFLTQTSDGFLWLNGDKGLVRFDGLHFISFKPLPGEQLSGNEIGALFPAQGGGLWIAYEKGAPILLKHGHLFYFGTAQGYAGTLGTFFADHQGTVWSRTHAAIMYFKQGAWHVVYRAPSVVDFLTGGALDARDNLWVAEKNHGLLVKRAGSTEITKVLDWGDGDALVTIGHSGRIYLQTQEHGCHIYREQGTTLVEVTAPIPGFVISVLETRSGGLWLTTEKGDAYYSSPAALTLAEKDHTTPKLVSVPDTKGFPWPLLEDHDGNVWLGRSMALDRFSPADFNTVSLPLNAHEISPAVDRSGGVWLGSEGLPVAHLAAGASHWKDIPVPSFTLATYADPSDDTVWGANPMGVWQLSPGVPHLAAPFSKAMAPGAVFSVLRDQRGTLFISTYDWGTGVFAWDGKHWSNALGKPAIIKMMTVDSRNHLWLSSRESNHLTELSHGVEHTWDEHQNLHVGMVRSIFPDGNGLWVGGDDGIQFFDGKRFISLLAHDPDAFQSVTGLVKDQFGNLWMQNLDGVLRIPATEVRKALAQPDYYVNYQSFIRTDGAPGTPDVNRTLPSLRLGADGRIWAHSVKGLAWIDPARKLKNVVMPPPVVESVSSNHDTFSASADAIRLTPQQDSFRIAYTLPALSRPERVQFSYRLAGFSEWTDAGTRREAVFTNVPPGHFHFEVRASGGYGVASVTSAPLTLIRLPAWYQTWWLRTLAVGLLILLVWLAFVFRLRYERRLVAARVADRVEARYAERERIARELHDTLLSGFQGLLMHVQAWVGDKDLSAAGRSKMDRVIDQTRDLLIQGRDRILELRSNSDEPRQVASELREFCTRLAITYPSRIEVIDTVPEIILPHALAGEVLAIAQEAISNAAIHANASLIEVEFKRAKSAFQLIVRDDGCGIAAETARNGGRDGHWGMIGMRERAQRIGAQFSIASDRVGGTQVVLIVPTASSDRRKRLFWRRRDGTHISPTT